ncbi:MAG: PAS domain S-box protein [Alphaproteobacteria bacterium]|nr:MAG: PAS domain S-box protein [Alphaproteobacteria bacterium]
MRLEPSDTGWRSSPPNANLATLPAACFVAPKRCQSMTTHTISTSISAEDRLRIATSAARIGVWEWDMADNSMIYSQIAKEICGFPLDQPVTFEMVSGVTHPEDFPTTHAAALRALDPEVRETVVYRYRIRRYDTGEVRWMLAYGEAHFDETGTSAIRYVGTLQDVTEQHLAEERLAASEARLRMAMASGDLAVWEIDTETGTITPSPELNRLCGFPEDARPSLEDLRSRYAPGERERLAAEGTAAAARGDTRIESEFQQIWPDGTEKWRLMRANILPKSTGSGYRIIGVLMDVTERKQQETRLDLLNQELRHRIKNSMAVVGTLATAAITSGADPQTANQRFRERLAAIGIATDLILSHSDEKVDLGDLIQAIIAPYQAGGIVLKGPSVSVSGRCARNVGMAIHELATNAIKYGSLSVDAGGVDISWQADGAWLTLVWHEHDGPRVEAERTGGFGSRLLRRGLFAPPESAETEFLPEGVRCTIRANVGDTI